MTTAPGNDPQHVYRPAPPPPPPVAFPAGNPASPYYPVQPGPPPHPGYQVFVRQSTNGLAIASMVLGILWIYWIGSILALVFGYVANSQIKRSGGQQSGRGMAIAGIVLGWVGIGLLALIVLFAVAASSGSGSS